MYSIAGKLWGLLSLLILGVSLSLVIADPAKVVVSPTQFLSDPKGIYYFDETKNVLLWESISRAVWLSKDEGKHWEKVKEVPEEGALRVVQHPNARKTTAIILTNTNEHYITTNAGEKWIKFKTELPPATDILPLSFNSKDESKIIYAGSKCTGSDWNRVCHQETFYTEDDFKNVHPLLKYTIDCTWASASPTFESESDKAILCAQWPEDLQNDRAHMRDPSVARLVKSVDFFKEGKGETLLLGVAGLGVVERFMFAAVIPAQASEGMSFHVSVDGKKFRRAQFPFGSTLMKEAAYTVLESSKSSLAVDLATKDKFGRPAPFGTLFFSDAEGTQYVKATNLEHTNRGVTGRVDFERIQASMFEGIYLANVVDNWQEIDHSSGQDQKRLVTKMSFGGEWSLLRGPAQDAEGKAWSCAPSAADKPVDPKCALHLHSVTEPHNIGRVFSTGGAPGILLGVGSVGPYLRRYEESATFVSTDAGRTWITAAKGPHKYESLDSGSFIVLVPDNGPTDHVLFSQDHGKTWQTRELKLDDKKWTPRATILDPESTSTKMLLAAETTGNRKYIVQLDFAAVAATCTKDDFELWTPKDDAGRSACFLGQNAQFSRRKGDVPCSAGKREVPEPVVTKCQCTVRDYECDVQFTRKTDTNELVCEPPADQTFDQPPNCPVGTKYTGKTGYRKVPGNQCEKDLEQYKSTKEKTCATVTKKPGSIATPPVGHEPRPALKHEFDAKIESVLYFRESPVMLVLTMAGSLYHSADEGATWKEMLKSNWPILGMGLHETDNKRAFFFDKDKVFYTADALATDAKKLNTPDDYNGLGLDIIDFHPDKPDWYVFLGGARDCQNPQAICHTSAYITKDNGVTWSKPLDTWANKCIWARDVNFKDPGIAEDAVFCTSFRYKNSIVGQDHLLFAAASGATASNDIQLVKIASNGEKSVLVEKGVREYYVVAGVLVVAVEQGKNLKLMVSTDGAKFEEAKYPPNANVEKNGYTILQSDTSIFLDIGHEVSGRLQYGSLFKSNGNGNYYSHMLANTNREGGQVDFEKMQGVGGVILANTVANVMDIATRPKRLSTVVSFDDGGSWNPIPKPDITIDGKPFDCTTCSLHLFCHGDLRNSVRHASAGLHSNAHAAGVMVAVGNVGTSLNEYKEGNVFITHDAGRTWNEVYKDAHRWAIGDSGGLIVIVNDEGPTNVARYSWDFGQSWATIPFADRPVRVSLVSTQPSSQSLKFVIAGTYAGSTPWGEEKTVMSHLDFSKLLTEKCDKTQFDVLTDKDGRCFLGRKVTYMRRKLDAFCYVGDQTGVGEIEGASCECTDADYECDLGFFKDETTKKCEPSGPPFPGQPENCPVGTEYDGPSGYRKISASKCTKEIPEKTAPTKRKCADSSAPSGVAVAHASLEGPFKDYFYFNPTTVMLQTSMPVFRISTNGGMEWKEVLADKGVTAMAQDPFHLERAWFVTTGKDLHYTDDEGRNFAKVMNVPETIARGGHPATSLRSHPHQKSWFLWHGKPDGCTTDDNCITNVWVSKDFGKKWNQILTHAVKCEWGVDPNSGNNPDKNKRIRNEELVFCVDRDVKTGGARAGHKRLVKTATTDKVEFQTVLDRVSDFVVYEEFVIAIVQHDTVGHGKVHVSMDGQEWAQAQFSAEDNSANGYTVLESSTGTIFLATLDSKTARREYGSLYTSNGNGTTFDKRLGAINMNSKGNADFEKMQGVEGIALVNQVDNANEVNTGSSKVIQTLISFNDGVDWKVLTPPAADVNKSPYKCAGKPEECKLHLHSYTSRNDVRDQFSASSAIGMMLGVGTVGNMLTNYRDADTFLTRDAGRTWNEIAKHAHKWEFGDHGGILLLVNDAEPTDHIKYSLNMGQSFEDFDIVAGLGTGSGAKLKVDRVFSEPGGTGTSFVIVGTLRSSTQVYAVTIDFSKAFAQNCDPTTDFEIWSPSGADEGDGNEKCLLGQTIEYHRRKPNVLCRVGATVPAPKITPCACTAYDYECEYNHRRVKDEKTGEKTACELIPGLAPPPPICTENNVLRTRTAYRKLRKSHCQGGLNRDLGDQIGYCGRKNLGFAAWFGIIVASVAGAAAITGFFIRFRGRLFGRIRLPLDDDDHNDNAFSRGPSSPLFGRPGDPFPRRAQHFGKALTVLAVGLAEFVTDKLARGFDAVNRLRRRRSQGYAPVGEYEYPPGSPTTGGLAGGDDDALLDLDDY
ncbi:hypothetical protein DFJ77DRAFT_469221 [Powellomyces hirtus]|nr:hypothetical protein DFJ77DRAFT_469221 [Powellomyces hirtus]